jgi:hypothetical protein
MLILFNFILSASSTSCPVPELIKPITCETNGKNVALTYKAKEDIDLKKIFDKMSKYIDGKEKSYSEFIIYESGITELKNETFSDITFESISISRAEYFKRIDAKAFLPHNINTIKIVEIGFLSLSADHINEFYSALASLNKVEKITLTKIYPPLTIPSNAFDGANRKENNLTEISIESHYSSENFMEIGDFAFRYLNNLKTVIIYNYGPLNISKHAFDFEKSSNQTLEVVIKSSPKNPNFEIGVLSNSKRPLKIKLVDAEFGYLDEKIFAPILHADKNNILLYGSSKLDCDCRMRWLKVDDTLEIARQVPDIRCKNGNDFYKMSKKQFDFCVGL